LIVDKTDLSAGQVWSNTNETLIGEPAQSSWDGLGNSNAIVSQSGHSNSAAALCLNSTNGGQSDWYLPSLDELSLLWFSRFNVNLTLSTLGGASVLPNSASSSANYWSSTERNNNTAWYFGWNNGITFHALNKESVFNVRAIRTFSDNGSQIGSSFHNCGAENVHNPNLNYGSITDQQGNMYRTIVIGNQEWMAENLKTSIYRNGDAIATNQSDIVWNNANSTQIGAWAYYENNSQNECPYGKLYNWYAVVDSRNLCPVGWRIPTDSDWTLLSNYLGGEEIAGGKMKSTNLNYWTTPNNLASNESGFSGLPGGFRDDFGPFGLLGNNGYWWSSTPNVSFNAWSRYLDTDNGQLYRYSINKIDGFSVRCLKE
jgi:uncharacterized protein (TIGR02145 family)